MGFHLCRTLTVLQRPYSLTSLYFTFMPSVQYFTCQWSTCFKAPTTNGILSTHCRRSKCRPKRPKASLYSSGRILIHCLLGRVTATACGEQTLPKAQASIKTTCSLTLAEVSEDKLPPCCQETVHIGEGEHQCSCLRTGEVEGSVVSALCCAGFEIHTSITPAPCEEGPGRHRRGVWQTLGSVLRAPWATAHTSAPQTPLEAPLRLLTLPRIQATLNFSSTTSFFYWCSLCYLWFRKKQLIAKESWDNIVIAFIEQKVHQLLQNPKSEVTFDNLQNLLLNELLVSHMLQLTPTSENIFVNSNSGLLTLYKSF